MVLRDKVKPGARGDTSRTTLRCARVKSNLRCDKDLISAIRQTLREKEEEIHRNQVVHGGGDEVESRTREGIRNLHNETLVAGEMVFTQMERKQRYKLPFPTQRCITKHMRRHGYHYKSAKSNGMVIEELYELLGVGPSAIKFGQLNSDFIQLCRNKIDNCIRTKGRLFEKRGYFRPVGPEKYQVEWLEWTRWWLDDRWDGNIDYHAFEVARSKRSSCDFTIEPTYEAFTAELGLDEGDNLSMPSGHYFGNESLSTMLNDSRTNQHTDRPGSFFPGGSPSPASSDLCDNNRRPFVSSATSICTLPRSPSLCKVSASESCDSSNQSLDNQEHITQQSLSSYKEVML